MQKLKRRHSLKWSMVRMLVLCWVLPVYLIVGGAGLYILHSMTQQAREHIVLSADNAVELTVAKLNGAVASSRKASYIPTIKDAWTTYQETGEAVELYTTINTFLYHQYKYDEKFLNTIVTFTADNSMSFYVSNVTQNGGAVGVRKYREYLEPAVLEMSKTLGTGIGFVEMDGHIFMVRNLMDSTYRPFAVIVNELNNASLFSDLANISWATDVTLWLNNTQLTLTGSSLPAPTLVYNEQLLTQQDSSFLLCQQTRQTAYLLQYSAVLQPSSLHEQRSVTTISIALISILLVPLFILIFSFFRRSVTHPLDAMTDAAKEIEQGHFGTQVKQTALRSSEFGYLGDSFNTMSNTLQNQFERIYKEELALRDARIMALQSQINPHFMNNTLEIINWEARMEGNIKVCNMLESLSTMLNAAMDRKKRPLVHLSEEIMYVDAYLYIISERLGKRLTVLKDIPDTVLDYYVPRLVLQPIMENAVEHGINPTQHGTIWVRAYEDERWLVLEVENDGVTTYDDLMKISRLLSDEPAGNDEPSTSLGIRNVHQRLRILYGPESGLSVNITKKGNTLCSIKIEKQQDKQDYAR